MHPFTLTDEQTARYHQDGYVLVNHLFDAEETDLLRRAAKEDHELDRRAFGRADGEGGTVRLSLWNHPGEGIYGMFALRTSGAFGRETARRRSLPLSLQNGDERRQGRRRVGVASGLRLLVSERRAGTVADQRVHRRGPLHTRERLPAGDPRLASLWTHRPCVDRRSGRRGSWIASKSC